MSCFVACCCCCVYYADFWHHLCITTKYSEGQVSLTSLVDLARLEAAAVLG